MKLFQDEQDRYEALCPVLLEKDNKIESLTSQSATLKENLDLMREENEELQVQCEVLEEEY